MTTSILGGRTNGSVVAIGECMVELSRGSDGRFGLAYGGDTFNTAVYMARSGVEVAYATALGDDPYSDGILRLAKTESIKTNLIETMPGRMPGLYMIETNEAGERAFWYWRDRAAARDLFDGAKAATTVDAIANARLVYFSGITLSLYSANGLEVLASALAATRKNGGVVAMDSNYRPRGWGGDIKRARSTFARFWALSHIGLPTFDDEHTLWSDETPTATADRLTNLGVSEIVVKNGATGALLRSGSIDRQVPCPAPLQAVDTTAAGDSFNAGYLARRLAGDAPEKAAQRGHELAGIVIQHRGAIVPAEATSAVLKIS